MPNIKEAYTNAKQRINPEGLAFTAASNVTSYVIFPPMEGAITYAAYEAANHLDQDLLKFFAVGLLGIANAASVGIESKALEHDNYSASMTSSTLNIVTGKPLVSAIGGHIGNYVGLTIFNPLNIFALSTKNYSLLLESEGAASVALTSYFITLNSLIINGKTQPFIDRVRKVREGITKRVRRSKTDK